MLVCCIFLVICPCQPPNRWPISATGTDTAKYCLSLNDFVSHKIMSSTLRASCLRMASCIRYADDFVLMPVLNKLP